jgi:hypothetical protein
MENYWPLGGRWRSALGASRLAPGVIGVTSSPLGLTVSQLRTVTFEYATLPSRLLSFPAGDR